MNRIAHALLLTDVFYVWEWEYVQGRAGRHFVFLLPETVTRSKITEMGSSVTICNSCGSIFHSKI